MVTELVSNAVRHAPPEPEGGIVLEIEREPGVVRIVVRDGDAPAAVCASDRHVAQPLFKKIISKDKNIKNIHSKRGR